MITPPYGEDLNMEVFKSYNIAATITRINVIDVRINPEIIGNLNQSEDKSVGKSNHNMTRNKSNKIPLPTNSKAVTAEYKGIEYPLKLETIIITEQPILVAQRINNINMI